MTPSESSAENPDNSWGLYSMIVGVSICCLCLSCCTGKFAKKIGRQPNLAKSRQIQVMPKREIAVAVERQDRWHTHERSAPLENELDNCSY